MQVGPIVPALLPPVVAKLVGSESSPLLANLLLVIAQLVHLNASQLVECLANQPSSGATLPLSVMPQQVRTASLVSHGHVAGDSC